MEQEVALFAICFALFLVSILYSSVGHGGASGYLAVLSLTSYGQLSSPWLKPVSYTHLTLPTKA